MHAPAFHIKILRIVDQRVSSSSLQDALSSTKEQGLGHIIRGDHSKPVVDVVAKVDVVLGGTVEHEDKDCEGAKDHHDQVEAHSEELSRPFSLEEEGQGVCEGNNTDRVCKEDESCRVVLCQLEELKEDTAEDHRHLHLDYIE